MFKTKAGVNALVLAAALSVGGAQLAHAAEADFELKNVDFSFEGPFGTFDRGQLQRGYKVYVESCAGCHGIDYLAFRNLGEPGGPEFSEDVVSVLAEEFPRQVTDGPDETGEMFERPGTPPDRLPPPFPNEAAARAANGGAYPPDLSVIAKARAGGPDYIYSILTGYEEPPADVEMRPGQYYNAYFPGHAIGMPPPLDDGLVSFDDGAPETLDQYAKDVSAFLMWTAEPKLEARRRLGFEVMVFLIIFAGMMYFSYKKLWRDVEH
ncbi:cytochrome c1 [Lutibaculum baratangense]|uniref:Cytochrome c1 n=1 Tax=Lutibaculum baratangense AMV1 TaxID=631454 RepID=V4RIR7_9HYPH|nr:cytochrome c1 [Lutibaculum baratangense]ESR23170.1 ubiquinol cytochrome C oxidoreductase, cytochrome C1 subunit [Lutibaculum baratangense AMV1]